tara:strand:+ start:443 stop:2617 length:2175 start_codon:yes stop_codon:yes gene_type:complete
MNKQRLIVAAATAIAAITINANANVLEEVVVTSQKRSESLQDVPLAVNVFTSDMIQEMGITNADELGTLTPSMHTLTIGNPFATKMQLRGIGTSQSDPALEPSVGVFVDGVFLGRSGLGMSDLTDIERIEVLQGPQGTLYGKNANAGAISIVTKKPNFDQFEGYANVTLGNYSARNVTVAATGPIGETSAFRLSANQNMRDGFLKNLGTGNDGNSADDWNIQAKLAFRPSDRLDVLFGVTSVNRDNSCCAADASQSGPVLQAANAGLIPSDGNDPFDYLIATNEDTAFELDSDAITLNINYVLDGASLTSLTSYNDFEYTQRRDQDRGPLDFTRNEPEFNSGETFSQEFRLTSSGETDLDYVVGLFYYDQKIQRGDGVTKTFQLGVNGPGVGTPLAFAGDAIYGKGVWKNKTLALFGQATRHFSETLRLSAGLRWTDEDRDADILTVIESSSPAPSSRWIISRFSTAIDESFNRSNSNTDWLLKLSKDLNDETMIYASAATGSKSGGFNGVNGLADEREFDDEETLSFEIGSKSQFLDSRLRMNAAVFLTKIDDYQFQAQAPSGNGTYVSNQAEVEVSGLDFQLEALPAESLTLSAAFLYMHEYEIVGGENKGDPLSTTADYTINLGARYGFPLASGNGFLRADYMYMDDHVPGHAEEETVQDRKLFNATLGWRGDNWTVSIWGKNLTDEAYSGFTSRIQNFSGSRAYFLAPPRTYGLSVRREF